MTSKRKNPEELTTLKIIGGVLLVLALVMLVIVGALLKMENKDLGTIGLLLVIATFMGFIGLIFSHLPREWTEGKKKNAK